MLCTFQCLSLVNEYYGVIYTFLVNELNPRAVCDMAGICHEDLAAADDVDVSPNNNALIQFVV